MGVHLRYSTRISEDIKTLHNNSWFSVFYLTQVFHQYEAIYNMYDCNSSYSRTSVGFKDSKKSGGSGDKANGNVTTRLGLLAGQLGLDPIAQGGSSSGSSSTR